VAKSCNASVAGCRAMASTFRNCAGELVIVRAGGTGTFPIPDYQEFNRKVLKTKD
jgi:hypothetical protein